MARFDFGGTLADFVVTSRRLGGLDVLGLSSATLTFWSAQTGGTRYTDLVLNGSAASSISVASDGQVPKFQGPDGVTEMWADGGSPRIRIVTLQGAPGPAGAASTVPGPPGPALPADQIAALGGTFTRIPDPGIPHFYVTKKGDDANDGRTWGSAKATVEGALTALAAVTGLQHPNWPANSGVIEVGYGVFFTDGGIKIPYGVQLLGSGPGNTTLKLNANRNVNVIQSAAWGKTGLNDIDDYLTIEGLAIDGSVTTQTGVAYESHVTVLSSLSATVPSTVTVVSTGAMPSTGVLFIAGCVCTYTGKTLTTFTGVIKLSGENTQVYPLGLVMAFDMQGHGLALQATRSIVRDVTVSNCLGSGFAVQSSGVSSPSIAYENKFINCRSSSHDRYGWEINEAATDGHIVESSGGVSKRGSIIIKSVNWHVTDFHAVGIPHRSGTGTARGLITICAGMQYFSGLYLDTAMHASIVIDTQKRQIPVYALDISADTLYDSAAGGASAIIQCLGNYSTYSGATISGVRARVRHNDGSAAHVLADGASLVSASVGAQDFTTQTKAQMLDASMLSSSGSTISLFGTLNYTGLQITETVVTTPAAVGAATLTAKVPGNLDTSGVVTVAWTPDARIGIRVKYTGLTVNGDGTATLTGIPTSGAGSIALAIPGGATLSQHFLTGISGSSATSVPDGSTGDAGNQAVWSISNFDLEYEITSDLVRGSEVIFLPNSGDQHVNAVDFNRGRLGRHIRFDGLATPKATVGVWTPNVNASAYYNSYYHNNGSSALNDQLTTSEVYLEPGTWTLDFLGFNNPDGATLTLSLLHNRGRSIAIGTLDQYAASGAPAKSVFTGIEVRVGGLYSLVMKATSKNASSTSYRGRLSGAVLTRTV